MIAPADVGTMAAYNAEMNRRLYDDRVICRINNVIHHEDTKGTEDFHLNCRPGLRQAKAGTTK